MSAFVLSNFFATAGGEVDPVKIVVQYSLIPCNIWLLFCHTICVCAEGPKKLVACC